VARSSRHGQSGARCRSSRYRQGKSKVQTMRRGDGYFGARKCPCTKEIGWYLTILWRSSSRKAGRSRMFGRPPHAGWTLEVILSYLWYPDEYPREQACQATANLAAGEEGRTGFVRWGLLIKAEGGNKSCGQHHHTCRSRLGELDYSVRTRDALRF